MAYTHKMIDGAQVPLTPAELTEADARDAAWAAGQAARDKNTNNARVTEQILAKELLTLRPMRELRRAQEHADVPAVDVTFARNRIKALDDEIKALRATLTP